MDVSRVLVDSRIMFILGIAIAFIIPGPALQLKSLIIPLLVIMMTFSIRSVRFGGLKKNEVKTMMGLIAINYIFLTAMHFALTLLLVKDPLYQKALLVFGIMPPAVGIISLTYLLKGDTRTSFIAEFVAYSLGILLVPLLALLVFGNIVSPMSLVLMAIYIIAIPFILSRGILYLETRGLEISQKFSKIMINIAYALSFYIVLGINKDALLNNYFALLPVVIVFVILKFGIATPVYLLFKKWLGRKKAVSYMLFATFKNGNAAMAITLLLFGVGATLPHAINAIIDPIYILFLSWFAGRGR